MSESLRVGIYLPSFVYSDDGIDHNVRLRTWIVEAEELGFDSIWVTDHLLTARQMYALTWLEPLTALTLAAALTHRVTLGPGVLLLPHRHPVLLAKEVASMQQLSEGRMVLGVGTGWYPPEFEAMGTRKADRGRRTDEVLEVVRQLLSGDDANFKGDFFEVPPTRIEPSPIDVPIWVGGGSQVPSPGSMEAPVMHPRVARRVARADGWFTRPTATPDQIADDWKQLLPHIAELGRDPNNIEVAHGQWLHLTEQVDRSRALEEQHRVAAQTLGEHRSSQQLEDSYLFGTLDDVVESCRQRAAVGISHLILHPYTDDPDQLRRWGQELLPRLHDIQVGERPT